MEINQKEIDALYELSSNISAKSKRLKYISFTLLLLMVSLIPLAFLIQKNEINQNNDVHQINIKQDNFEEQFSKYIDTIQKNKIIINDFDLVKNVVIKFCDSFNNNNLKESIDFYADTLQRFYLKENIEKIKVEKEIEYHLKKFPNSKIDYNDKEIFVSKTGNEYLVYMEVDYYEEVGRTSKSILYEIKLNQKYKITYIRNYISRRKNNIELDTLYNLFQIVNPHEDIILKRDTNMMK